MFCMFLNPENCESKTLDETNNGHCTLAWMLLYYFALYQVRNEFYKDTQGAILAYDVGSRSSFEALDSWLAEMKREMADSAEMERVVFCVCANKVWTPLTLLAPMFMLCMIEEPNLGSYVQCISFQNYFCKEIYVCKTNCTIMWVNYSTCVEANSESFLFNFNNSSLFSRSDGSKENRNAKWMQFFFTTVTSWKQRRIVETNEFLV